MSSIPQNYTEETTLIAFKVFFQTSCWENSEEMQWDKRKRCSGYFYPAIQAWQYLRRKKHVYAATFRFI